MAKGYLSNRQKNLKIGISSYTESQKVLEVIGKVGIGTIIDIVPYDTLSSGTLSFEGSAGQLFSITNNLTSGSIFSVNDVSGIPSIDVDADGTIQLAPYGSTEYVGIGTTNPTAKLDVNGTVKATLFSGSGASLTSIPNAALDNSAVSYGGVTLSLGGSDATPAFNLQDATNYPYTSLTGITTDIVGDTTPQLGGNLDLNNNNITGTGNIDINGTLNVSGVSTFQSDIHLGDNDRIYFGDGNDLQIYHDGTDDIISSSGSTLKITGSRVVINNAANNENQAVFTQNGSVELYYDNSKKFETTGIGVSIVGTGNTATITGPSNLVLDPGVVGDNTGTVTILGNLQVDGTQTVINSTTMTVDDLNITLASGAANASAANGAGITVDGASATLTYSSTGDKWVFNKAPYYNTNRLLTTADEGSGNGIDADTVDGLEASSFLRSDTADTASGVITFSNGNTTYGTSTALSAEFGVNTSAAGAIKLHGGTSGAYGLIQETTSNLHIDNIGGGTYLNYYDGNFISFGTGANSESARFTGSTGTLTLGTITETGTANQKLQVTGGAYVSGDVGIGITNPGSKLAVGGTITELYNGSYWNVVTQADVGYGASQVPLNQYLGQLAFLDDHHPNGLRRDGGGSDDVSVDANGNVSIGGSVTIAGITTFQGDVDLGDNDRLRLGDGNDLQIYHDGTDSVITESGTGNLLLGSDSIVYLYKPSTFEAMLRAEANGPVGLFYDASKKFETTGVGVTVFGTTETQQLVVSGVSTFQNNVYLGDNDKLSFGPNQEFDIYWTGGASILSGNSIQLRDATSTENYLKALVNSSVELYYDNNKKFETTADGILVNPNVGLGTTAGNADATQDLASFQTTVGNVSKLRIVEERDVNGTDWTSAYTRIQKTIDSTDMGYIQFNGYGNDRGMEFGTSNDEKFAQFIRNGAVELYYNNTKKFETTGIGVSIVGTGNTATITGPSNLVLDPGTVGDNTGTVTILGNLQVEGTQTIINSTILEVDDKLVSIAKSATNATQADGAGLEINGASASLIYNYNGGSDQWVFNKAPYYNTNRLLTTADEGSGNSLDADTVDGVEASSFLRSDQDDTTTGQIQLTKANNAVTGGGQIFLNGAIGNRIDFNGNGVAAPVFGTRSVGTKLVLYPSLGGSTVDYALGVENATLWYSIPAANNAYKHRWYAGTTQLADLKGSGELVIGSTSLTGTASQNLQVTGGAYVSGNLGVGVTNPTVKLQLPGNSTNTADFKIGEFFIQNYSLNNTFFGNNAPWNGSSHVRSKTGSVELFQFFSGGFQIRLHPSDVAGTPIPENSNFKIKSTGEFGIGSSITGADFDGSTFYHNSQGDVGIGTTNPQYKLHVIGSFAATTKSFVIDHPTKECMKLRYGSLEGPENGVYVRGRLKDNNTIELPEYWTGLVDEDSITVNLTPIGRKASLHSVVDVVDNTVVVESANDIVDCFYTIFAERKDVEKLEVEF